MTAARRQVRANTWKIARFELWAAALFCGIAGCLNVFSPQLEYGYWGMQRELPVTDGLFWWAAAVVLAGAAQAVDWRLYPVAPFVPHEARPNDPFRRHLLLTSLPFLVGAFALQEGRNFTIIGLFGWGVGLVLVLAGLLPRGAVSPRRTLKAIVDFPRNYPYTALALTLIMAAATFARFYELGNIPGEMTSDHVEKLLDAQRILEGGPAIFFGTNGGRESFHMYLLVALSPLTGGLNFNTLKLGAVLESLVGILAFYGFGHALIGDRSQRARNFGLLVALMGAVGLWHLIVTRVSLRIMLTPLVTTLLMWALIRLIRHNKRQDALWAGLIIGFGFYSYQSLRIVPLLAVIATGIGIFWTAQSRNDRMLYLKNFVITAVVAFAMYLPVLRYWVTDPQMYWSRVSSTVMGADFNCAEDNIECVSLENPAQIFAQNMASALLMFTYRGDGNWAYNAPTYAALDPIAGGFFVCGIGAWLVWSIKRRDPIGLFMVAALVIMLVPSAVTLARSSEVPSNTRASGAMPMVYALVAFGVVGTIRVTGGAVPPWLRLRTGAVLPILAACAMFGYAWNILYHPFDLHSQVSAVSAHEVGKRMRAFADDVGAWGNMYLLHQDYYLDFRAVMIQAGEKPGWEPNIYGALQDIPLRIYENWLNAGPSHLDPSRDLLFIYSIRDPKAGETIRSWFPNGTETQVRSRQDTPWIPSEPTMFYRVPALGEQGLIDFLREHVNPPEIVE